jgi:hypothetical protein
MRGYQLTSFQPAFLDDNKTYRRTGNTTDEVGVNPGPMETDRTFAFAGENERCKASDLPAQPNISFQSMPPSKTISQRADTSSQPPNTDTVVIKLSRHGAPPPTLLPDSLFRWA